MDSSVLEPAELRGILREISDQVDGPIRPEYIDSLESIDTAVFVSQFGSLAQASIEAGCSYVVDTADPDVYAAGLSGRKRDRRQQLIEDLIRIVDNLGHKPTARTLKAYGRDLQDWKIQEFGSWTAVVLEAGLDPNDVPGYVSPAEFIEEVRRLTDQLGAPPSRDFAARQSKIDIEEYDSRFPTWKAVIESAGLDRHGIDTCGEIIWGLEQLAEQLEHRPNENEIEHYTGLDILEIHWMFGSISNALDEGEIPSKRGLTPCGSLTRPPQSDTKTPSHTDILREVFTLRRRSEGSLETAEEQQRALERRGIIDKKHYEVQFGSVSDAFEFATDLDARAYSERRDERVRDIPKELLAEYAQELAEILDRRPLVDEVVHLTDASLDDYIEEFDSWEAVFKTKVIGVNKDLQSEVTPTNTDLLEDLERVGAYLERPPTCREYRDAGYYPVESILRRFGSWPAALAALGVEVDPNIPPEYFAADLTHNTIQRSERLRKEQFGHETVLRDDLYRIALEIGSVSRWEDIDTFGAYPITAYKELFHEIPSGIDDSVVDNRPTQCLQSGTERTQLIKDIVSVSERLDRKVWPRDIAFFGRYTLPAYLAVFETLDEAFAAAELETDHFPQTVSNWAGSWDLIFSDARSFVSALQTQYEQTGSAPTMAEMNDTGTYAQQCYDYYDTWREALIVAGIPPERRSPVRSISRNELLDGLRELDDELGYTPRTDDMQKYGEFGVNTYYKYWSSWKDALDEAGLSSTRSRHQRADPSETGDDVTPSDRDSDLLDEIVSDIENSINSDF